FLILRAGFDRVDMDLVNPWPVPQKVGGVVPESRPEIVFPLPDTTLGFGFELRELSEKFGFQVFPLFGSKLASNLSEQLQLFPQLHTRGIRFPTLSPHIGPAAGKQRVCARASHRLGIASQALNGTAIL